MKSGSLWSPACPVRLQHEVALAPPSATSARISPHLSARPNLRPEWNVPKKWWYPPLPQSHKTVPHYHSVHFGNHLVISASWMPAGACLPIHRCAAIFKPVVPLLNLCDAHSIITESRLNLPIGFHLAVIQFLAAPIVSSVFLHWKFDENTSSLKCRLPSTDAIDR